jgi:hypothetical protein
MQNGGGAHHPVTEHPDTDTGANSMVPASRAILLQPRYTVTVNIPAFSARAIVYDAIFGCLRTILYETAWAQ